VSKETERAAISAHFKTLVDADFSDAIAWPNKTFVTPKNRMFLVFSIVDRGTVRHGVGISFFKRHF
jgi:hypothetical protein